MDLSTAASYFDATPCSDVYSPYTTIYGQIDLFDDSRRDGATVSRRILSVAPGILPPARRVLAIHGDNWLVGTHEADSFQGEVIRDKWILHKAQGPATIRTPAQTLAAAGGTSTYAARMWVKDVKEPEVSSHLTAFYNVYLPSSEAVAVGNIVELAGVLHITRGTFLSVAGFNVAEVDELGTATRVTGCTYTPQTYSAAADSNTAGAAVTLAALSMRFQDDYVYPNAASPKMEPGDRRALVLKSAVTPDTKGTLAISGVTWRIVDVQSEDAGCWALHLRLP